MHVSKFLESKMKEKAINKEGVTRYSLRELSLYGTINKISNSRISVLAY